MQRVRRDERDRHRVEPAHEHRPAVREVVRGRAGRRRADHPVARERRRGPRRRPPTTSSTIRPSVELVATTSLTATCRSPSSSHLERRQLDDAVLAGEDAREVPSRARPAAIDARKPTRPKLTPITGTSVPRKRCERAQHRAVAAERDGDVGARAVVARRASTPRVLGEQQLDAASTRLGAEPVRSSAPCVTTAARANRLATAASIRSSRSSGSVGSSACDEVEEELPVALRAGEPGVYDADDARPPAERRLGDLAQRRARATPGSRTTPPLPTSLAPASNCGFTSTTACQPGAARREHRRQRDPDAR